MANSHLATYLNDHLAGSATALELLSHLKSADFGQEMKPFFAELYAEILADRIELENIMDRLQIPRSRSREAVTWLADKMAQFKLRLDDPTGGDFYLLESLEILALGIEGKQVLWTAIEHISESVPELRSVDFERLRQRAAEQRGRVEERRLTAVTRAFRDFEPPN